MKNIWSKDLTSKVILVFVSLIFSSVDLAASAKTADKSAAPQSRFAKTQYGVHAVYRTVYLWTVPMHRTKTRTHHE
jgi:hypothetical protein